jgi:RNA polymerase sigma-B factor
MFRELKALEESSAAYHRQREAIFNRTLPIGEFLSFAVPTIMGEVRRHFRDFGWSIKVPRRVKDLQVQLSKARDELTHSSGRAPTASELAAHLGVDRESVLDAIVAASSYSTVSTDVPSEPDGESPSIANTLGVLDPRFEKVVDIESIRPLIAALPDRHRTVLFLRFFEDMTQSQIAQRLGYSQMHVSRLLGQALDTLRTQIAEPQTDYAKSAVG